MILSVDHLDIVNQGGEKLCSDISFELQENSIIGILGESGSGKTITGLSILHLLPAALSIKKGNIIFFKSDKGAISINELSEKKIREYRGSYLSMIFQDPLNSLNPSYRCGIQVREVFHIHQKIKIKEARNRVMQLFKEVSLPDPERIYRSYPHQLSGGMQQRVMIAMALANNPRLIIADEPTTALDVTIQKDIISLFKRIQHNREIGIIFISHDIDILSELSNKILVFYKGELVESGTTDQILNYPRHPYTKGLIACKPSLDEHPLRLPTIEFSMRGQKHAEDKIIPGHSHKPFRDHLKEPSPIFSITNLSTGFADRKKTVFKTGQFKPVLKNISFDIFEGETFGLVGESGSGKSTLAKNIMKITPWQSGKIWYRSIDMLKMNNTELKQFRRNCQIIFQNPYASLNPRQTVGECILEPVLYYRLFDNRKDSIEYVYAIMEKVGLKTIYYKRYPHQLSGGERQRTAIARTLTLQPEFLICDEAVSALDVSIQAQILNLFNDLKEEYNLTYLFISHDLSVVKYMSDRVGVLCKGELVELNDADKLYRKPDHPYTKKLITSMPGKK